MKYEDIEKAQHLKNILLRLEAKYAQICKVESRYNEVDSGGVEGVADTGYHCFVSEHTDGSGSPINLSGCYVGSEVINALKIILAGKYDVCKNALENMGIEVKDMDLEDTK